jgi:Fe-S-cluster containining protein
MTDTHPADRAALVEQRINAVAQSDVGEKLAAINERHLPAIKRRMIPLFTARNQPDEVKTRFFLDSLDPLTREVGALAACRKGCSHCCNIAVAINQAEAAVIGRRIGRKPAKPANRAMEGRDEFGASIALGFDKPCPFLKEHQCSIYDVRPLACRSHFNMDIDAELCRVDLGNNRVPLYKTTDLDVIGVYAAGGPHKMVVADIREFFPPQA